MSARGTGDNAPVHQGGVRQGYTSTAIVRVGGPAADVAIINDDPALGGCQFRGIAEDAT